MATTKVSLKLLIDTKAHKVLFAEASKDFIDFLFSLLSLPVGTVVRLLGKHGMLGSLGNLYDGVQNLNETYVQPNQNMDCLLNPKAATCALRVARLLPSVESTAGKFFVCGSIHRCVTDNPTAICPHCKHPMSTEIPYIAPETSNAVSTGGGGFVKGVVTYMVMDDLAVMSMSTISSITVLNRFNVKEVTTLEEKVVDFGAEECLELLKASLQSKAVLTQVFLVRGTLSFELVLQHHSEMGLTFSNPRKGLDTTKHISSSAKTNGGWFSNEDVIDDETETFFTSKSFSFDSFGDWNNRSYRLKIYGIHQRRVVTRNSEMGPCPFAKKGKVQEIFALVKRSRDPCGDFKTSMVGQLILDGKGCSMIGEVSSAVSMIDDSDGGTIAGSRHWLGAILTIGRGTTSVKHSTWDRTPMTSLD
ncbi:hypothetical protein HHK36_032788 [Tetracentron sinense]|uniref:Uncharacterized protein n=1 Tax=Tetracentron sinense TaxID=13715 RepID=A0A834Y4F1_TETSI|nr:hypothetical protein HHK36_032788 [Tetracentron sinense]